ncbi:unnamed protein product [Linum trigynum]|uniref:Uncharacterized protein n=1 Tax=Linum trigynum TaxID=586398 RepID=A0AAV2EHW3_9ROSI
MAGWTAATVARKAANFSRLATVSKLPSPVPQASSLIQRRGMAGGGDPHGPPKVNFWQDLLSPSKWKDEHFVIVSIIGWALAIYGGSKLFTGDKGWPSMEAARSSQETRRTRTGRRRRLENGKPAR